MFIQVGTYLSVRYLLSVSHLLWPFNLTTEAEWAARAEGCRFIFIPGEVQLIYGWHLRADQLTTGYMLKREDKETTERATSARKQKRDKTSRL